MADPVRVLVVSDTHLDAPTLDRMPPEVWAMADRADLVLHAGDVVTPEVLAAFSDHAPVRAVLGNNDRGFEGELPEQLDFTLAGVRIAMVHDLGPRAGRAARMARRFPDAQVVVFGHSHDPVLDTTATGALLCNPGSPTQRRRQRAHTVAWLELADGAVVRSAIVPVGPLA